LVCNEPELCMMDPERQDEIFDDADLEILHPAKAVEILKVKGIDVTLEQAALMLELLGRLSTMIISQHLRQCK
jgi:hypothetical protein